MAEVTLTSYATPVTILSTELDSLAAGSESTAVPFDNSTGKKLYIDIQLDLASVDLSGESAPNFTLRHAIDTGSGTPDAGYGGNQYTLQVAPGSGAAVHRSHAVRVVLSPGLNYFSIVNNMDTASLAASGNTLVGTTYGEETA